MEDPELQKAAIINLAATVSRLENKVNFLNTRIAFLETKIAEYDLAFEMVSQNINSMADRQEEQSKDVKAMLEMSKKVHDLLVEKND